MLLFLVRKDKGSLDAEGITDNKKFWKTIQLSFSDKSKSRRIMALVEDVKTESNHKNIN